MSYKDEIIKAMLLLAKYEKTIFLGQSVAYPGSAIYGTCKDIPDNKKIELPLIEDMQLGMSIGLSLEGYIPISIYPRFDFLILATNQLVNHLDKIDDMSVGRYKPKVIIRTVVGSTKPLYPGKQHCSDYTEAYKSMLKNVEVIKLIDSEDIVPAYKHAIEREDGKSSMLIEVADLYSKE